MISKKRILTKNCTGILLFILSLNFAVFGQPAKISFEFAGRNLITVSDADMMASAYVDGILNRDPNVRDALTIIGLPLNLENPKVSTVNVSNSVQAWAKSFALSPNGKFAYVVETRAPAPNGTTKIDQIPNGKLLTTIDLSNPLEPKIVGSTEIGRNPKSISVHPNGKLLGIGTEEPGKELVLMSLENGKPDKIIALPIADGEGKTGAGVTADDVVWHPSGRFLAVVISSRPEVQFYRLNQNGDAPNLTKYGNSVRVGKWLSAGKWRPDGKFFIVPDLKWGTDVEGFYVGAARGALVSIRFDEKESNVADIQHAVVSTTPVDKDPETFDISPDGSLAVSANMRRSYLPFNDLRLTRTSSLSLVRVDKASGKLETLGEYEFEGILPEGVAFSADGKAVAIAVFDYLDYNRRSGGIEFWRIIKDGVRPTLERTGFRLSVTRGAHQLVIAP